MTFRSQDVPLAAMDGLPYRAHAGSPVLVMSVCLGRSPHRMGIMDAFETRGEAAGWAQLALRAMDVAVTHPGL